MTNETELSPEEAALLEQELNRYKQAKEAEARQQEQNDKKNAIKQSKQDAQDASLYDVRIKMRAFETLAGDLIHDPDFLWFMISLLFTKRLGYLLQERPNKDGTNVNTFTQGLVEAYKRDKGL